MSNNTSGGVICNTPPWDDTHVLQRLYANFDGLDLSFQGCLPESVLKVLERGKQEAKNISENAIVRIGHSEIPVSVRPSGSLGGYAYKFDTGPDGAIWFIKATDKCDAYAIRVSVRSEALALYGYEGVKQRLRETLIELGAKGPDGRRTTPERPLPESISRVDFCIDYVTDKFEPDRECVICHSNSKVNANGVATQRIQTVSRGTSIETLTIGQMPNRQVQLYDKTKEVRANRGKQYWWHVWGLDRDTFDKQMWRLELRIGKPEFERWRIKTFDQLEAGLTQIFEQLMKSVRYAVPTTDSNISRWPDSALWIDARNAMENAFAPYTSNATRYDVIETYRNDLIEHRMDMIKSALATLTYTLRESSEDESVTLRNVTEKANDKPEGENALCYVTERLTGYLRHDKADFQKKVQRAADRYVFLNP